MTLILAAANFEYVIHVSDRRLSAEVRPGKLEPVREDASKSLLIRFREMDLLFGYTGLAAVPGREMIECIADCFLAARYERPDDPQLWFLLGRIQLREFFKSPAITKYLPKDRRLSVLATGFVYNEDRTQAEPRQLLMSNFQQWGVRNDPIATDRFNFEQFGLTWDRPNERAMVQAIGAFNTVKPMDAEDIRELLQANGNPRYVRDRMKGLFAEYAERDPTIGRGLNMTIIYPSGAFDVQGFGAEPSEKPGTFVLDLTETLPRAGEVLQPTRKELWVDLPQIRPGERLSFPRVHPQISPIQNPAETAEA